MSNPLFKLVQSFPGISKIDLCKMRTDMKTEASKVRFIIDLIGTVN